MTPSRQSQCSNGGNGYSSGPFPILTRLSETRLQLLAWDKAREVPADCPNGDRHEDGVRPARDSCVERGNLRLDAKGDLQVVDP
jgi:hypothetical protein